MVNNTIHATYTETYDLNTILNELNILAIHTPQAPALKRMFHGFLEQYSKMKILGCNFKLICATRQELTPDLIGTGDGQLDARDVLNPILFKACTGDKLNVLLDQIYNRGESTNPGSLLSNASIDQHIDTRSEAISSYYALLADDSFRREHPQRGITVMGLKPMVHRVVTTQPFGFSVAPPANNGDEQVSIGAGNAATAMGFGSPDGSANANIDFTPVNRSVFVSNGLTEMPWLDTSYTSLTTFSNPDGSGENRIAGNLAAHIPRVYMGCLVLPPCIRMPLWYRMQIVWHVAFKDFRPAQDIMPVAVSAPYGPESDVDSLSDYSKTYWNLYHTASKLDKDYGSFDASAGIENVEKVNEKVN